MTQPPAANGRGLLRPLQLTAVVFFTVSGGPYGLEPVLQYVGGGFALALILVTPLLWVLPSILMVLELNGMMPLNGGYYQWVKSGLGLKWGFFEGWWSWLFTFTDLAIYPVLFVQYLSFFYPEAGEFKIPICLSIIWISAILNLLGILPVGRSSVLLGLCVLVPFGILFGVAVTKDFSFSLSEVSFQTNGSGFTIFGMGLYTVMWNFLGWDNSSSFVEEVHRPARSYLISIIIVCALVVSGMVFWEFGDLLIIDVTLYGAALFLEFVTLIVLRLRKPDLHRPFKIPLSVGGLVAMTALPVLCFITALSAALSEQSVYTNATLFAIAAVLTAPMAWMVLRPKKSKQPS